MNDSPMIGPCHACQWVLNGTYRFLNIESAYEIGIKMNFMDVRAIL